MSSELSPVDFGLSNVTPIAASKPGILCYECGDLVDRVRWSEFFCPDCDIKRMARIDKSMKEIAEKFVVQP